MSWQRPDGRQPNQLRPVNFELNFTRFSAGSVLAQCGETKVLCTASIEEYVPRFLLGSGQGWLTAEYRMLPSATQERQRRELLKLSGRTQEIQRLIGRSLRSCIDLQQLGERSITIDCDVLQADAGTRTTSITGGYVALALALNKLIKKGELIQSPLRFPVAAISVGLIEGEAFLDLNYPEDSKADIDFNVVMTGNLDLIEVQGTAEENSFTRSQLNDILDLAELGIKELVSLQNQALSQA
ncbi:ribonuclease PH [Crocosphaera subtropica ATCC 51142]|uniref:Ribonuclease PH n=1 Tax=Crocosphaera subtropica (strain ATCC 51142 / BH68) TaxID=43989 RepID=RNPH_CROS5|nr:ribonuclease PH [Crocosphaera subtropica]B1WUL8.1 RecName: Full=Ribonuclease PH; Short=RNase PH; AltName: Full=tRNA nucleotidyltransferase [Crocosphaera subtropica ATCC 51142]ACB53872.1 ribonuclease PH [Crocosphaera subtropica ATCC 51142]